MHGSAIGIDPKLASILHVFFPASKSSWHLDACAVLSKHSWIAATCSESSLFLLFPRLGPVPRVYFFSD